MGRQKFVAGNWKMYTDTATARRLAAGIVAGLAGDTRVKVAVCPPFPYLLPVAEVLRGSPILLGAQSAFFEKEGAYTGEVSPWMLVDVGCRCVILGHSERRYKLGETDPFVNRKVHAALSAGLEVILCLGELTEDREAGRTIQVLQAQLASGLVGVTESQLARVTLAYEPVWAIGTGRNATSEQAQEAHAFIRGFIRKHFGEEAAARLPIQYGGSMKPSNAAGLLHQPDVDGGLIGGASLDAGQFLDIVRAALPP
jgi:triosephosphate isomerase